MDTTTTAAADDHNDDGSDVERTDCSSDSDAESSDDEETLPVALPREIPLFLSSGVAARMSSPDGDDGEDDEVDDSGGEDLSLDDGDDDEDNEPGRRLRRLEDLVPSVAPRGYQMEMRLWLLAASRSPSAGGGDPAHGAGDGGGGPGLICFLPTGTGKTLVSCLAVLDFVRANARINPRRARALFVADTVALCRQQASALRDAFRPLGGGRGGLKVAEVYGGSGRFRSADRRGCDVVCGTAARIVSLLSSGTLRATDFCLVVVDEIHHALRERTGSSGSGHPYAVLMRGHVLATSPALRPKILGLTATPPLSGRVLPSGGKETTCTGLERATGGCVIRAPSCDLFRTEFEDACRRPTTEFIFKTGTDEERRAWDDYVSAADTVGSDLTCAQRLVLRHCNYLTQVIRLIRSRADVANATDLRVIVFVTTVRETDALTRLFRGTSASDPISLVSLNPQSMVGRAKSGQSSKSHNTILSDFRSGRTRLLVCTSVLEEGIDVPSCNLVVRLDGARSLRSYVQSRGRARAAQTNTQRRCDYVLVVTEKEKPGIADMRYQEWYVMSTVNTRMREYDASHPEERDWVEKMCREYQDRRNGKTINARRAMGLSQVPNAAAPSPSLAEVSNTSLCIAVHSACSAADDDFFLRVNAKFGVEVIQTYQKIHNGGETPMRHKVLARCLLHSWKRKERCKHAKSTFDFLLDVVRKSASVEEPAHPDSGRRWFSIEAQHGNDGKNLCLSEHSFRQMELGDLVSPTLFQSHCNSWRFLNHPTIEILHGKGKCLVRFHICPEQGNDLVWPSRSMLSDRTNARMDFDLKEVVSAVVSTDGHRTSSNKSLLLVLKRPPYIYIETEVADECGPLYSRSDRAVLPEPLAPYFQNHMAYRLEFVSSMEIDALKNVVLCLESHHVPLFYAAISMVEPDPRLERSNLEQVINGNLFTYLPYKIFQSEYPWLAHHFFCLGHHVAAFLGYVDRQKDEITKRSVNRRESVRWFWSVLFSVVEYFDCNIAQRCFFHTEASRDQVIFPSSDAHTSCDLDLESSPHHSALRELSLPPHSDLVLSAKVTASGRVIVVRPTPMLSNRVIRHFTGESVGRTMSGCGNKSFISFLRLAFVDEDLSELNEGVALAALIESVFEPGVPLGPFLYKRLHWSNSQMRGCGMWFAAPIPFCGEPGLLSLGEDSHEAMLDGICSWVGTLPDPKVHGICKYASRLALAFSSSVPTIDVDNQAIAVIADLEKNDHCFTDGAGQISVEYACRVASSLGLSNQDEIPSAFQIRFRGCKGVLTVNPHIGDVSEESMRSWFEAKDVMPTGGTAAGLSGMHVVLRKSQVKFRGSKSYSTLEVLSWAKANPCYLNQQIILLLSARGVRDEVFLRLMSLSLDNAADILTDSSKAHAYLRGLGFCDLFSSERCRTDHSGINFLEEPFFRSLLRHRYRIEIGRLIRRTAIYVPDGACLIGVPDDFRVLRKGEVFVQVRHETNKGRGSEREQRIDGPCVVTKNPCLHPGDILRLHAVRRPDVTEKLGHLWNVIVFPTAIATMERPYPDMMSGSDLDGDIYFVSWNKDLLMWDDQVICKPMDYAALAKPDPLKPSNEPKTLKEYYIRACCNNNLGVVANAHKVWADWEDEGAAAPKCVELAKLHSIAVDFPKTGIPAELRPDQIPREYPKWMNKWDKPTYDKDTVLQKCFDLCPQMDQDILSVMEAQDLGNSGKNAADAGQKFYGDVFTPDPRLLVQGYEKYIKDGQYHLRKYNGEILQIMRLHGLQHEGELFDMIDFHRGYSQRDRMNQSEMVRWEMRRLRGHYRTIFQSSFCDERAKLEESIKQKASAWYYVAYEEHRGKKGGQALLSFAWIMEDMLLQIMCARAKTIGVVQEKYGQSNAMWVYESIGKSIECRWNEDAISQRLQKIHTFLTIWEQNNKPARASLAGPVFGSPLVLASAITDSRWLGLNLDLGRSEVNLSDLVLSLKCHVDKDCRMSGDLLELPNMRCQMTVNQTGKSISQRFFDMFHFVMRRGFLVKSSCPLIMAQTLPVFHAFLCWADARLQLSLRENLMIQILYLSFVSEAYVSVVKLAPENQMDAMIGRSKKSRSRPAVPVLMEEDVTRESLLNTLQEYEMKRTKAMQYHESSLTSCESGKLLIDVFQFLVMYSTPRKRKSSVLTEPIEEFLSHLPSAMASFLRNDIIIPVSAHLPGLNSIFFAASKAYHQLRQDQSILALFTHQSCVHNLHSRRLVLYGIPRGETEWVAQQFHALAKHPGSAKVLVESSRRGPRLIIEMNVAKQYLRYAMTLFHCLKSQYNKRQKNSLLRVADTFFDISGLIIAKEKDRILTAMKKNEVIIIEAATGSGKSTAVPKLILDDRDADGLLTKVMCFQPRRIAAVSLAVRVADISNTNLGDEVGYFIGGDSRATPQTRIIYCTSAIGMLHCLQEAIPFTHVVIDEIHGRSIFDDIAMAVLKHHHLVTNKSLKLVLMSASADMSQLEQYFKNEKGESCIIIRVEHEPPYSIEIKHLDEIDFFCPYRYPAIQAYMKKVEVKASLYANFIVDTFPIGELGAFIQYLHNDMKSDGNFDSNILVFLPGRADILELSMILDDAMVSKECQVWQLRGGMPIEQQQQIMGTKKQKRGRAIILSTDVVESSVTIPECDVVIDTMLHKRKQPINARSREQQLMMALISKDEATQRTGRTGRTKSGKVYRLVSRRTYECLPKHPKPEMESANIADVLLILQELLPDVVSGGTCSTVAQDFSDPRRFLSNMVLSPPPHESVDSAYMHLEELGAFTQQQPGTIGGRRSLTVFGKIMKELYFDPGSVLMVLNGMRYGVLDEAIIIAAILQRGSPFYDDTYFEPFEKAAQIEMKMMCGKNKSDLLASMYSFMAWRLENMLRWKRKMMKAAHRNGRNDKKKRTERGKRNFQVDIGATVAVDSSDKDIHEEDQWCFDHFLSISALREIEEVCIQIYDALAETGCFLPSTGFKERTRQLSTRNRKARVMDHFQSDSAKWKKDIYLGDFRRLLGMKDLYQQYAASGDSSPSLSIEDREDVLCWIIAATFPSNILTVQGALDNKTVSFFGRRRKQLRPSNCLSKESERELCSFLKKAGLNVQNCRTSSVDRDDSGYMHSVTFCTTKDADVASRLRPANGKYPYTRIEVCIDVTKQRVCYYRRAAESVPMIITQETVAELSGTNMAVCANILPNKGKGGSDTYVCFDITVLPRDIELAVYAATYPSFPVCSFNGMVEYMDKGELDSVSQAAVSEIRRDMDSEFVDASKDRYCHSKTKIVLSPDVKRIVRNRREKVLKLMRAFRRKAENAREVERKYAEEVRRNMCTVDVTLPINKVGLVIGKKGSKVKSIEQVSGAKVNILKGTNVATVEGHRINVKMAISLISGCCKPFRITVSSDNEDLLPHDSID